MALITYLHNEYSMWESIVSLNSITSAKLATNIITSKLTLGLVVTGLVTGLLSGCNNEAEQPEKVVPVVKTITIDSASTQPTWSLVGTVSARYQSNLAFRVSGKIEKRLVNVGDTVKPGQVLYKLDPTDYQLAVNIAVANVNATQSEINNAKTELARYESLFKRNLSSQQVIDQAQTQLTVLQEQLKAQKLQEKQARNQLQYTTLKSPGLGKILAVMAEEDEVVSAGKAVASLALNGSREVSVSIPETRLPGLPKTAQVQVYGDKHLYPVKLRQISGQADPASRTWQANYAFELGDKSSQKELDALNLGQTAKLIFAMDHSLIKVPNTALYEQADFSSVWQVKEGKVHRIKVKVKSLSDRWAWVEGDFSEVKTIVALGAHLLNEGEAVRESAE